MKNLSNYEIHEALNGLWNAYNTLNDNYLHVKNVYPDVLKTIEKKIEKFTNELEKRYNEKTI